MNNSLKMALTFSGAVVAFGLGSLPTLAQENQLSPRLPAALKVTVDIPELYENQKLVFPHTLINQSPQAHFDVVIENVSSQPVFLWDQGNSAGYGSLTLTITEANGQTIQISPQSIKWSKNIVRADRLAPGEVQVREVYYTTQAYSAEHIAWTPFPFPQQSGAEQTVTLQAVFEQIPSAGAARGLVWTGKAVSKPLTVVLDNAL